MGIRAAATFATPRSVASKLNWAAAFLVSRSSIRMPSSDIARLVSGANGTFDGPTPIIRRSAIALTRDSPAETAICSTDGRNVGAHAPGRGHSRSKSANALGGSSNWPFLLMRFIEPLASHGRQWKTSPSINRTPLPPVIVRPLFSPNPSYMHTSTEVEGAGVFPSTSRSLKLVGGGCAGGCWSFLRLGTA